MNAVSSTIKGEESKSPILECKNKKAILTGMAFYLVPRGGIEPPTQGFSVPCSTD